MKKILIVLLSLSSSAIAAEKNCRIYINPEIIGAKKLKTAFIRMKDEFPYHQTKIEIVNEENGSDIVIQSLTSRLDLINTDNYRNFHSQAQWHPATSNFEIALHKFITLDEIFAPRIRYKARVKHHHETEIHKGKTLTARTYRVFTNVRSWREAIAYDFILEYLLKKDGICQ